MKCPKCKFYNICKGRLNETVENCVRFKSVEQTNEEWLKSLNTEDFAKAITNIEKLAKIDQVIWWLKENHK